ncbi:MAG: hypothetical protein AAFU67_18295, partial [Bacteroidota bacterium]
DLRHQLKWVNTLEIRNWLFSAGWTFHSGARFSPIDSFAATIDEDNVEDVLLDLERRGINSGRLPVYHRLDLSIFYHWKPKNKKQKWYGRFGISLLNVYGRANPISFNYLVREVEINEDEEEFFLQELEKIGLGFTPNISVKIGWK